MAQVSKVNEKADVASAEVVPTLFIGLGGAGAEALWRIRRRFLNKVWHDDSGQVFELGSLEEFPFAEFLQIDLDQSFYSCLDYRTQQSFNTLADKIRFKEEEKLVKKLDLNRYFRSEEDLDKYPLIKEWFPLARKTINELNIDPEKGTGQIRAISRLYFFDKYQEIRAAIRCKCDSLLSNMSSDALQKRLGLQVQMDALKIVVVASTAGGTGSGSFLDIGYLAGWVGKQAAIQRVTTNLVLMLPTAYQSAGPRTEANTYAALMEMETCMRQGSRHIHQWVEEEVPRDMPAYPYSDVYLLDTANLAGAKKSDISDLFDMIADALFEDFSEAKFGTRKRRGVVHLEQHKAFPYFSRVDRKIYGDMKLMFSKHYSSFGQATLDFRHDSQVGIDGDDENPIFLKLDRMPDRTQLFSDFLQRAMPWVDAEPDKYLTGSYSSDQYRCYIGVKDSKRFEACYGTELRSRIPSDTMMTGQEIKFVEIDTPGKLVCYTELSGLTLPSLKAMDDWYAAYCRENDKIPVHTHRLTSTFVHARELTLNELASRAEDFKLFVQAVALGVLTRIEKGRDAGLYTVRKKGRTQAIGDEKRLRMNGMPGNTVEIVKEQVNFELESLGSVDQLAIWVALIERYAAVIYPLAVMQQDGVDVGRKSLPTLMCEKLVEEWAGRLERKVGKGQAERLMHQARAKLIECTEEIPGSTADVYPYEVKMDEIQPKRVLRRIVLDPGWSLSGAAPAQASVATPVVAPQMVMR